MSDMTVPDLTERVRDAAADAPKRLARLSERGADMARNALDSAKEATTSFADRFREDPVRTSAPVVTGVVAVTGAIAVVMRMTRKQKRGRKRH